MECDEELPSREAEAIAALRASPLVKEVGFNTVEPSKACTRAYGAHESVED